ncbi:MAG: hypothetical protein U1E43_07585 [Rhodospirillales bacterium]
MRAISNLVVAGAIAAAAVVVPAAAQADRSPATEMAVSCAAVFTLLELGSKDQPALAIQMRRGKLRALEEAKPGFSYIGGAAVLDSVVLQRAGELGKTPVQALPLAEKCLRLY